MTITLSLVTYLLVGLALFLAGYGVGVLYLPAPKVSQLSSYGLWTPRASSLPSPSPASLEPITLPLLTPPRDRMPTMDFDPKSLEELCAECSENESRS